MGFGAWVEGLAGAYGGRLEGMLGACGRWLPRGVCGRGRVEGVCGRGRVEGGMFLWVTVRLDGDLDSSGGGVNGGGVDAGGRWNDNSTSEVERRILERAMANGVQVTPGSFFDTRDVSDEMEIHFRLTCAAAEEGEIDEGVRRFANAIREEFGMEAV